MLRYFRITLSLLILATISFVFLDFTGAVASLGAWIPKWQVVPALLALNVVAIVVLALATFIFGRAYCSILCPLGISQDIIIWLRRKTAPKRKSRPGLFGFKPESKIIRYSFLATFVILIGLGLLAIIPSSFAGLLDPYSIFGRIIGQLGVPVWRSSVGAVAEIAADNGHYIIDSTPHPAAFLWPVAAVAIIQLLIVGIMAWRSGRSYCNIICPVGTLLGLLSRFSLLRPEIDLNKCNRCGRCGRHCKAMCINTKEHKIDYSRCIVCMDCLDNCTQNAISYTWRRHKKVATTPTPQPKTTAPDQGQPDTGRRAFISGLAIAAGTGAMMAADGGLAPLKQKQPRRKVAPTVPAGAVSLRNLRSHCTACQLCISACPNGVLKPSINADGFMQPVLQFTDGFCRPECTACSNVCPTGALKPISVEQKAVTKIGTARVDLKKCISAAFGQTCGNCASHCPAGAIKMVRDEENHMRPTVNAELCIGCGSCEYHCPSGTVGQLSARVAAIYVDGIDQHRTL